MTQLKLLTVVLFVIVVSGIFLGIEIGYSADSIETAHASYNGSHLTTGETTTEMQYPAMTIQTGDGVLGALRARALAFNERVAQSTYNQIIYGAAAVADITAPIAYLLSDAVPLHTVKGTLYVGLLGVAGVQGRTLYHQYREVRR